MSELTAEQRALLDSLSADLDQLSENPLDQRRIDALADHLTAEIDQENIAANSATPDSGKPED